MNYWHELEPLWKKMEEREKKRVVQLLSVMVDAYEKRQPAPPVILIRGQDFPSRETILKALADGSPVIRVKFVSAGHCDRTPAGQPPG